VIDDRVDDYLDEILYHIEGKRVIPIVGEELLRVQDDDGEVPLYTYIARRLAQRLAIGSEALTPNPTLNEVACHYLASRRGAVPADIYRHILPILEQAKLEPPEPLLQLAAIEHFDLYLSLTFDSLLARAIDQIRGAGRTLELAYTTKFQADLPTQREKLTGPVVYHLLGMLSPQPQYVITEEDTLEFMHHMQGGWRRAENLFDALRENHLLFIGCTFSDWLARFLIRVTKSRQFSQQSEQMEMIVASTAEDDANLVRFLNHFSPRTKVLSHSPIEFVAALSSRYDERIRPTLQKPPADPTEGPEAGPMEAGAIFISYTRADQAAARTLGRFLERQAGADVWLDTRELGVGDDWDRKIQRNIKNCSYFMPVISASSTDKHPGYSQREWNLAADRAIEFAEGSPFILPVVVDDTPSDCEGVPGRFSRAQWIRLRDGEGTEEFRLQIVSLMRDYRRRPHS
jgi:hypothetical protein